MATFLWVALGIFVIATAAFLIYILTRKRTADQTTDDKDKKVNKENSRKSRRNTEDLRISPKTFSVGPIITEGRYISSNLCDNTKLFPMKDIYVNYGREGRIPDNARCAEYIQPP